MSVEQLIDLRKEKPAPKSSKAIYIAAKDLKKPKGFILKNNCWLMPINVADNVKTKFSYNVPKAGIYQVDLVHPYVSEDAMPSYQINLIEGIKEGRVGERLHMDKALKNKDKITTPVTLAYLSEGLHKGSIGGKFFVGFSHIVITPLPEDDPLPGILKEEAERNLSLIHI